MFVGVYKIQEFLLPCLYIMQSNQVKRYKDLKTKSVKDISLVKKIKSEILLLKRP